MPRKPEWIPDHAYMAYQKRPADDQRFLEPIYFSDDNSVKNFWGDFSKGGRFFFAELNEHLVRWKNYFDKKQEQRKLWADADDELKKLQSRIDSSLKIISTLKTNPVIKDYRFGDLERMLQAFKNCELEEFKKDKDQDLKAKNKYRALTRQSNDEAKSKAQSLGKSLYAFFQEKHIQKDWKKPQAHLKKHICSIVNLLIDNEEHPLTEKELTDAVKNFQ